MTKLDQLPSELISLILNFVGHTDLITCTLVNRSFYNEAMPLLWWHFDIDSDEMLSHMTTLITHSPNSPGQHIRSIRIDHCWSSLNDDSFLALIQYMPRLEILDLPQADMISDTSFQHVPHYCPHLTSVNLFCGRIPEDCGRLTHVSMMALGQHCHQLSRLSLYGCAYLDYILLFSTFKTCPLTHLRLSLPYTVDGLPMPGPFVVENSALNLYQHHRHALTTLCLSESDLDATIFVTASNTHNLTWPHLIDFSLWSAPTLTDDMAMTFLQRHPQLEKLSLHHSLHLTDEGFLAQLPITLPGLIHLDIDYNDQLTVGGICHMIKAYGGKLTDGVHCEGCSIHEKNDDFPSYLKKMGRYRLTWNDIDDPEVVWISGHAFL